MKASIPLAVSLALCSCDREEPAPATESQKVEDRAAAAREQRQPLPDDVARDVERSMRGAITDSALAGFYSNLGALESSLASRDSVVDRARRKDAGGQFRDQVQDLDTRIVKALHSLEAQLTSLESKAELDESALADAKAKHSALAEKVRKSLADHL